MVPRRKDSFPMIDLLYVNKTTKRRGKKEKQKSTFLERGTNSRRKKKAQNRGGFKSLLPFVPVLFLATRREIDSACLFSKRDVREETRCSS